MNRKKLLATGMFVIVCIAAVCVSLPFITSLKLNAKAYAKFPRIDLSSIKAGTYKIIPNEYSSNFGSFKPALFILRKQNGGFNVWDIYTMDGVVAMPDLAWWRPGNLCKDFGPVMVNGLIDEAKPISCHDSDQYEWAKENMQWNIDGKSLSKSMSDMLSSNGVIENDHFVYGKRK